MALNRLGDPADGRCLILTAHDTTGTIRGFLSFVPWGSRGVSLDLMRRDRSAENASTNTWCRAWWTPLPNTASGASR